MSELPFKLPPPDEVFRMYPQLAGRVTNLRGIIQNPGAVVSQAERDSWKEEIVSVLHDFRTLCELTNEVLKSIPRE